MHSYAYTAFFPLINLQTTVLTPNRRLSATLHQHYQKYRLDQGDQCWQTPDILPISSWIERLWDHCTSEVFTPPPLLLNSAQEQFLWECILSRAKENDALLQLSETADIAKSAWQLLKQWQIDIEHPVFKSADDYAALQTWAFEFRSLCQKNNWIDRGTLPDRVTQQIKAKTIQLPKKIILTGFTELSPQLKQLLAACQQSGCQIETISLTQSQTTCARVSLTDQENELITMACWAKATLEHCPDTLIGCVIPLLDKKRDRVMQIFSEVFANENAHVVEPQDCPFNISAGKTLSHYPVIHAALQLLALHKKSLSAETIGYLLLSPFLGEAEGERIKRAHFDKLLRQSNNNYLAISKLVQKSEDKKQVSLAVHCPQLTKRIQQFLSQLSAFPQTDTYSAWGKRFIQLLATLGWPGERSVSSDEYQVIEAWLGLIAEYSTLDQVATPVNLHQALQTLHKMASKTLFQPKTPEAPIQILGLLEAAALPFDYLWVSGMDDMSWPPQPKPNPFIPKSLQRERNMPHATAERELMFCQILTQQFRESAKRVIFSHAEKNEELELQASPLIRDFSEIKIDELGIERIATPSERIYAAKKNEVIEDEMAPPHSANEKTLGGMSILKQQALCPFKAFAEWRLHAHELEKPLPGLRTKDRGTIIHKILEIIWSKLQDQATLMSMDDATLNTFIHDSILEAQTFFPPSHRDHSQYISLEKQRLHKLIQEWLLLERERPPFKVIMSEKAAEIRLNQLVFSIRIDRVDELPDGKKLIIDYKTGKHNEINSWFGDRPEEPQLPLYTLLDSENTVGITFAQVASGEHGFKGLSQYSLEIKGIKLISEIKKTTALSWQEQRAQWHAVLTQLSDDFCQGVASVNPKDPNKTCIWCGLKPLCRINEKIPLSVSDQDISANDNELN
ncbi:PD-(D/E)XK nuclease family protein [Aquicella lusitana]|uniref:Putative DNA repair protein n=1 Tax=Aquicella lusitana TaxID=254246 RepID=A0A370GYS2_9COXI|nr:PD-(D/E)XK nuclease family protein [Aquicella lusitana]RDI48816.1 putative DNA repair protein [Aquicella lusitana]VVC73244.1 RecBCD enzyme subunit RecC [Aquicella lusitana]